MKKLLNHVMVECEQLHAFKIDRGENTKPYTQFVFKTPKGVYFDAYGVILKKTPKGYKEA